MDGATSYDPVTASLRRRLVALWIDGLILIGLATAVFTALGEPLIDESGHDLLPRLLLLVIVNVLEHVFLMRLSATPGKLLTGIYVGTESGGRISHSQALIRELVISVFFIDFILPASAAGVSTAVLLLSTVMAIADSENRALHDRIAGTRVLRGKAPTVTDTTGATFPRL